MFRSDDGGATFAPRNDGVNSADEGFCVHSLAHDPAQPDAIIRRDHRGMYRSDDAGDSWRVIENGLPVAELADGHRCCFGFACQLDPGSGSLFTVPLESDGFRYPKDAELAVYRSRNGEMDGVELTQEVNAKYLAAAALAEAIAQDLESQAGNSHPMPVTDMLAESTRIRARLHAIKDLTGIPARSLNRRAAPAQ